MRSVSGLTQLDLPGLGRAIHRRHHVKADGRDLYLYGYHPHTDVPLGPELLGAGEGGQLRWHPLRQEWNIYAAHRQNRTFKPSTADDPLAPARPDRPPTEIPFERFELAVFENRFTSLHPAAPEPASEAGIRSARAEGQCDVVVYGPAAEGDLASLGQDRRRLLIAAWLDRYEALYGKGYKFVLPFENRGDEVGVTLHHPHGQIYAFPFVPQVQARAADAFAKGYDLAKDIAASTDIYGVSKAGGLQALCPPYARFPYEVWIAPRRRHAGPWTFTPEEVDGFAHLLGDICRRYDAVFGRRTPYMLSLHAAPPGATKAFHFTAQFYPLLRAPDRVKYLAAVEQATGAFTVDVMPEVAARTLRDVL
jgi:UDPglucose--hexose-1-phosphate uridylyltransferase